MKTVSTPFIPCISSHLILSLSRSYMTSTNFFDDSVYFCSQFPAAVLSQTLFTRATGSSAASNSAATFAFASSRSRHALSNDSRNAVTISSIERCLLSNASNFANVTILSSARRDVLKSDASVAFVGSAAIVFNLAMSCELTFFT